MFPIRNWDKVLHLMAYSLLGFLGLRACQPQLRGWGRAHVILIAVLGTLLYGISDEIHQSFVPLRSPEVADVIADGLGGMVGACLFIIYGRLSRHLKKI